MRLHDTSTLSLLAALSTLTHAVSLSDMTPRAHNLPSACQAIYTEQVSGCTAHDFISGTCTGECIGGLESLIDPIRQACGDRGISGENLIVAYLANEGPEQICHNLPTGNGWGSSASSTWETSTRQTSTKPTRAHRTTTTAAATPTYASSISTAQPITSTPTSIEIDTSSYSHPTGAALPSLSSAWASTATISTPSTTTTTTSTSQASKTTHPVNHSPAASPMSTSSPATQMVSSASSPSPTTIGASSTSSTSSSSGSYQTNMHDGSGGGSPFDTEGNLSGATSLAVSALAVLLSAGGVALWTYVL